MSVHDEWEASVLARAREGLALPSDEKSSHLARLESHLALGTPASVVGDPALETSALTKQVTQASSPAGSVQGLLWKLHPATLLTGGLIVGGLTGMLLARQLPPPAPPPPASVSVPNEVESSDDVVSEPLRTPPKVETGEHQAFDEEQEPRKETAAAPARRSSDALATEAPPEPTFYEELSYLRRAQAALRAGNPSLALGIMTSLDEIQKVGALDVERRVTKALALCALSRPEEARAVSAPIFSKQKHSVYAERLKESCVGSLPASLDGEE